MTHYELVKRAERWLANTKRCYVVLTEPGTLMGEIPDAIGWTSRCSILVECKSSRGDFLRDKHKPSRRVPALGLGQFRYYMCPPALVSPNELPEKWGLLEVRPHIVKVIVKAKQFLIEDGAWGLLRERMILCSEVRRLQRKTIDDDTHDADGSH
jgi:hypothetical protein